MTINKTKAAPEKLIQKSRENLNYYIMKKLHIWSTVLLFAVTSTGAFAQQITGSSLFSPSAGGARILSAQGNTAASPAIGFQSSVSSTGAAQEDGGGGNGIFRPLANTMAFATASLERMRIDVSGDLLIGTATALGRLTATTTPGGLPTAIVGTGISTGVFGEATDMNGPLTDAGIAGFGTIGYEAIGVHGKGTYLSTGGNGNIYGVVGTAGAINPLNNIGVFGEAHNANGYNSGIIGLSRSTTGIYNTGVGGQVTLNTTAAWNRAISGLAPVAPNHFAGYFDGNVDIKSGVVTIGNGTLCTPTGYKLFVEQGILTEKVKVAVNCSTAWADYVFANDYKLKPLLEVEAYVKENKHLPNIPSASELVNDGLNLGEMQAKQMEKIEELTLYMIEMKKEIDTLKKENQSLKVLVAQPKN
jgi:hypothetical protein